MMKQKTSGEHQAGPLTGAVLESVVASRAPGQSLSTRQGYEALMNHLRDFAGDGFSRREIDAQYLREFAAFLSERVKRSSVRGYMERMSALLKSARRMGLVAEVPEMSVSELAPRNDAAEKVFLTKEELARMRDAESPAESTKNAFLFSCYTGLLIGEVEQLRWDSIRYSGTGLVLTRGSDQGGDAVKVPIIEPAHEILKRMEVEYSRLPDVERDERVFHLCSDTAIGNHIRVWASNAHIDKKINYSTSRHTFATMALRAGIDLYVVAKWCGYSNVQSAQVYADLVAQTRRTDSEALEAAFR